MVNNTHHPGRSNNAITAEYFTGEQPPSDFNLTRYCIENAALKSPNKTALIVVDDVGAKSFTYQEIESTILRIANGLRDYGFASGSRLFIRMGNNLDYALMFFAVNAAGLVPIPASSMLSLPEARFIANNAAISAIISDNTLSIPADYPVIDANDIARLKTAPPGPYATTKADDPAFLIYTSGSSGTPKGVLHAQRAIWGRRPMYQNWYGITSNDRLMHTGAFNWTYTLGTGLFDPWANGATAIIHTGQRTHQTVPQLIEQYGPTIIASVPGIYRQMLKYNDLKNIKLSTLRHGLSAGEALSNELANNWQKTTGLPLYEALGMSEISTYISTYPGLERKPGSPGKPQKNRAVAILAIDDDNTTALKRSDIGLIAVHKSDPGMMLGYWADDNATNAAYRGEWFISGDLGALDEDGYLHYHGRQDDVMNASGYRVSPQEVEAALGRHPDIVECGVIDVPITHDLSIITAFIIAQNQQSLDLEAIKTHMKDNIAAYKCPKNYVLVDELPRTGNGKLVRKNLRKLVNNDLS